MLRYVYTVGSSVFMSTILSGQYINLKVDQLNKEIEEQKVRHAELQMKFTQLKNQKQNAMISADSNMDADEKDTYVILGVCSSVIVFGLGIMSGMKH
jgi:outer membrane murein-binding lipoprotein Lpp